LTAGVEKRQRRSDMPDEPVVQAPVLIPFTCPWAKKNLADALAGMAKASGGVLEYHIGSRGLTRAASKSQIDNVAYWDKWCRLLCPDYVALPTDLTGADTACRIINRDT